MSYETIGYAGNNEVYQCKRTGKLVVHYTAIKGIDCSLDCPKGYDKLIWDILRTGREYRSAYNIAKSNHSRVIGVNNKFFGGGLSFDLTLSELQNLDIWN